MRHTLIFVKKKINPSNTQTIKFIGLIISFELALKIGLWTCFLYLFSKAFFQGGAKRPPPRLYIDSDPPAFIGLRKYIHIFSVIIKCLVFRLIDEFVIVIFYLNYTVLKCFIILLISLFNLYFNFTKSRH